MTITKEDLKDYAAKQAALASAYSRQKRAELDDYLDESTTVKKRLVAAVGLVALGCGAVLGLYLGLKRSSKWKKKAASLKEQNEWLMDEIYSDEEEEEK